MATILAPSTAPTTVDAPRTATPNAIHIPLFAWIAVAVVLLYITWAFAGTNVFPSTWNQLHEFFHDGRHFLGIPCH